MPRTEQNYSKAFDAEEINQMLTEEVIKPAATKLAAPIVIASKKDGLLRFRLDHHKLNTVKILDSYPFPLADECINSTGEQISFLTLDANSGYWQIKIYERERNMTAFTLQEGLCRFTRIPFRVMNAPATFQRAMDAIPVSVCWQLVLIFLKDIVVPSKSPTDHIEQERLILRLTYRAGVTLKQKTCRLLAEKMDYSGHPIRPERLGLTEHTTSALEKLEQRAIMTELHPFLGFFDLFRRFAPNFVRLSDSLHRNLKIANQNKLASWMKKRSLSLHR